MQCPACRKPLREKSAGDFDVDMCYGGCGGIWFDATELSRVSHGVAITLQRIYQVPGVGKPSNLPRLCPRCLDQVLDRTWFSPAQKVEIDQCPTCNGIWLDDGEFAAIYEEVNRSKIGAQTWEAGLAKVIAFLRANPGPGGTPATA